MNVPVAGELADTHCHLNFDNFDADRGEVIERAINNGITRMLIPGVDLETSRSAVKYASEYAGVYAAVGIHPNESAGWNDEAFNEIRSMARSKKVRAIGEIGLDYYRERAPKELQRIIFRKQLDLAYELGLPVIIHNRESSEDLLEILNSWLSVSTVNTNPSMCPGVVHSFFGDDKFAGKLISMGFKIGINGPVTFKNSTQLQSLIATLDLEDMIVETDAPFLSPQPLRGQRNEPANVRIVAEKIAELRNDSIENVAIKTTTTADKLFGWRDCN